MWFFYHSSNGQAPRAVFAANRGAADAYINRLYSDGGFQFVGQDGVARPGYQQETSNESTTGTTGTGTSPTVAQPVPSGTGNVAGGMERNFGQAAYRRGLERQGVAPEGIFSDYLQEMYDPTAAAFAVESAMGRISGEDKENAFQNYTAANPLSGARQRGAGAFWDLYNNKKNLPTGSEYIDPYAEARTGGTANAGAVNDMMALAEQAAATKYSPFAAKRLFGNSGRSKARYEASGFRGDFMDELRKFYGL